MVGNCPTINAENTELRTSTFSALVGILFSGRLPGQDEAEKQGVSM
jgi:hypothetical protein